MPTKSSNHLSPGGVFYSVADYSNVSPYCFNQILVTSEVVEERNVLQIPSVVLRNYNGNHVSVKYSNRDYTFRIDRLRQCMRASSKHIQANNKNNPMRHKFVFIYCENCGSTETMGMMAAIDLRVHYLIAMCDLLEPVIDNGIVGCKQCL